MMLAHLSDLHVADGHRLEDQRRVLDWIVDDATAAGDVEAWLITGDLYGRAVPHEPSVRERAALEPVLVRMALIAPVVVLVGNHDQDGVALRLRDLGGTFPVNVVTGAQVVTVHTSSSPIDVYGLAYPSPRMLLAGERMPSSREALNAAVAERLQALLGIWRARMLEGARRGRRAVFAGHFAVSGAVTSGGEVLGHHEPELAAADLEALPVAYGALGHLHRRQEPARGWWYAGSPWATDFGEREAKSYTLVDLDGPKAVVTPRPTPCRRVLTLDWRWAPDREGGQPRWVTRPTEEQLAAVAGAEVRARLIVPDQWVAGCPFDAELARLQELDAWHVQAERRIEPTLRVRAPAVAEAPDLPRKVEAFWSTRATRPDPREAAAALLALDELRGNGDDAINAATEALLEVA